MEEEPKKADEREQNAAGLRRLIQVGLDSGPPVFMTRDGLREMIRDHAAALREEAKKEKRPAAR